MAGGFVLGVDFGTSNTAAVLRDPHGATHLLMFGGVPQLPSAVFVDGAARLAGRDALHRALSRPSGLEPHPKRRIDDGTVLLGSVDEVPVADLIAVVLRRVNDEAVRIADAPVDAVTVTCPATWGPRRRSTMDAAARAAGMPAPSTVDEPVAAAAHAGRIRGDGLPPGRPVLVYDLGAGTCDASLVRRTPDGIEVIASRGLDDAGGLDVDAAMVASMAATLRPDDPGWPRLLRPETATDLRARIALWDAVRGGKEQLSHSGSTTVYVPLLDEEVPFGREEFDTLARPVLRRTVRLAREVLRGAGIAPADLGMVALVGGSSRLPLVASMLHADLGVAPVLVEQPELAVAYGSISDAIRPRPPAHRAAPARQPAPEPEPEPTSEPTPKPGPKPEPGPARTVSPADEPSIGRRLKTALIRTVVLVLLISPLLWVPPLLEEWSENRRRADPTPDTVVSPTPSASTPPGELAVTLDTGPGRGCELVRPPTAAIAVYFVALPVRVEWRSPDGAPAPAETRLALTTGDDPWAFDARGYVLKYYLLDQAMRVKGTAADHRPGERYFHLYVWDADLGGSMRILVAADRTDVAGTPPGTASRMRVRLDLPSRQAVGSSTVPCSVTA